MLPLFTRHFVEFEHKTFCSKTDIVCVIWVQILSSMYLSYNRTVFITKYQRRKRCQVHGHPHIFYRLYKHKINIILIILLSNYGCFYSNFFFLLQISYFCLTIFILLAHTWLESSGLG